MIIRIALLCSIVAAGFAHAQEPVALGDRLEPLFDRYLIDHMDGTALRLHEPQLADVALRFDAPWEGRYCGYVTVFRDGERCRMYYRGMPANGKDGSEDEVTCYAESPDGIHWTRPTLGLFDVNGSKENNVILAKMPPFSHNFAPWPDTRPGVAPEERYKALAGTSETGLVAFVSGDGIHWRKLQEQAVLTKGAFDSQNVAFWSESENCYVAYVRVFINDVRWVSRCTSPDFVHWSDPCEMDKGDAPWEHIYTNQTTPYFRAPHLYLAIAARFMPGRRVISAEEGVKLGLEGTYAGDCSDNVLMTSRGGCHYDRTFLEALMKPGIGLEHWSSRTNYPARGLLSNSDKEMSLYVQHAYGQPTHYLARYAVRTDGFVSVNAPYAGGEWRTRLLTFSGKELVLNYATSAAGDIRVEIQDADGKPIPGFTLADADETIGNWIERPIGWKGATDVSSLAGKPIRLRFVMKDADLYALRFR